MDCNGKITYPTKSEAREAKNNLRKYYRYAKFYKCPICKLWHTTRSRNKLNLQVRDIERQHDFRQAIRSGQANFIRRISNKKTVWKIFLGKSGFIVTYDKKSKLCKINYYLGVTSRD